MKSNIHFGYDQCHQTPSYVTSSSCFFNQNHCHTRPAAPVVIVDPHHHHHHHDHHHDHFDHHHGFNHGCR